MNGQSPPQPRSEWEAPRTEGSDPTAGSPAGALDARPDVVILTGMSGAGRSTAAHAMEDAGWYVVDNLPPQMLPALAELANRRFHPFAQFPDARRVFGGEAHLLQLAETAQA